MIFITIEMYLPRFDSNAAHCLHKQKHLHEYVNRTIRIYSAVFDVRSCRTIHVARLHSHVVESRQRRRASMASAAVGVVSG